MKCFFNEGLVMFDQEMKVFYKTKQLRVKTSERKLHLVSDKILYFSCNLLQLSSFEWLPIVAGFHHQSTEILKNFQLVNKSILSFNFFQASLFYYTW